MLSEERRREIKEQIDFYINIDKTIKNKNFLETEKEIRKYIKFFLETDKDEDYLFDIIRNLDWLRQNLNKTQYGEEKFDDEAKKIVTLMNQLVLILAYKIINLNGKKKEQLLEFINRIFGPVFTIIPEEREGYASFEKINPDLDYYNRIYLKTIEKTEEEFKIDLDGFREWKDNYNKELAKKWGLLKNG